MSTQRRGFTGNSAANYFTNVSNTIQSAQNTISSAGLTLTDYQSGASLDFEDDYVKRYDHIVDGLVTAYSTDAVRSDEDIYGNVNGLYKSYDNEMESKITYMIEEIKSLCENHLQIPSATPKIEAILNMIQKSLQESTELSNQTSNEINRFANEVLTIDMNSPSMMGKQWVIDIGPDGKVR